MRGGRSEGVAANGAPPRSRRRRGAWTRSTRVLSGLCRALYDLSSWRALVYRFHQALPGAQSADLPGFDLLAVSSFCGFLLFLLGALHSVAQDVEF